MSKHLTACPYCGQIFENLTEEDPREICDCARARSWRSKQDKMERAREELLEVLQNDIIGDGAQPSGELIQWLVSALPLMLNQDVSQVVAMVDGFGKVTITLGGSWKIKKQRGISVERKV